ncbi:hypothetical protein MLD38_007729 [Melastoma candidum]|uniref:Uncharacterized protein n=1 Tax=Melastoma candidum TaxID=119954 RepID=A0ACB9RS03_9MYRT|nr:hypothetical protein MLD38_007729 [Melastoma candidum]
MGLCASSPSPNTREIQPDTQFHDPCRSTSISIIWVDGKFEEHERPFLAGSFISRDGNQELVLCSSEHLAVDSCPTPVRDDEELQLGHIYFLLPVSQARTPLSLADLCDLTIKARAALGDDGRNH